MKKIILLSSLLIGLSLNLLAQISAVTNTGDEVILYENGTWKYKNDSASTEKPIDIKTNPKEFVKSANATFLLKSTKNDFGVYLNAKNWRFEKASFNSDAEFEFKKNNDAIFGMMINESLEIPLETLKIVVFKNAERVAKDINIEKEEYRIVNAQKVLCIQFRANVSGVKLKYFNYYFSNSSGTTQLMTYCGENEFKTNQKEIEEFLNGFVVLNK